MQYHVKRLSMKQIYVTVYPNRWQMQDCIPGTIAAVQPDIYCSSVTVSLCQFPPLKSCHLSKLAGCIAVLLVHNIVDVVCVLVIMKHRLI